MKVWWTCDSLTMSLHRILLTTCSKFTATRVPKYSEVLKITELSSVSLHSLGIKCIDTPSTTPVLLHPQAMHRFHDFFVSVVFMPMVNDWFTVLAHCQLIRTGQTRKNNTFIRPWGSITHAWLCFHTRGDTLSWHHTVAGSSFSLSDGIFRRQIHNLQISLLMRLSRYGV